MHHVSSATVSGSSVLCLASSSTILLAPTEWSVTTGSTFEAGLRSMADATCSNAVRYRPIVWNVAAKPSSAINPRSFASSAGPVA